MSWVGKVAWPSMESLAGMKQVGALKGTAGRQVEQQGMAASGCGGCLL